MLRGRKLLGKIFEDAESDVGSLLLADRVFIDRFEFNSSS